MRKFISTIFFTVTAALAAAFSAYAGTVTYIRGDLVYPASVDQVHPELVSFESYQIGDAFQMNYRLDADPAGYAQGEVLPVTIEFTAIPGNDFLDIKKASIRISDQEPDSFELSEDGAVLTAHFTFPALSVQLEEPEGLYFEKSGVIGWERVKNADYYEVDVENVDSFGQRVYMTTLIAESNRISIRDTVYSAEGDYLYSVRARSNRYFRKDSEKAKLPLNQSVIITKDDIGYPPSYLKEDGTAFVEGDYVRDTELKIGGSYYYFNSIGKTISGWRKEGSSWYYYSPENCQRVSGPVTIDGADYLFDEETGKMLTGFQIWGEQERYFSGDGKAETGWVSHSGKIYYILPSGERNTRQLQDPDGRNYIFDSEGVLIQ